jgi:hypothetical protein
MKIAVASLGNFHANPFGPELQVKRNVIHTPSAGEEIGIMVLFSIYKNSIVLH